MSRGVGRSDGWTVGRISVVLAFLSLGPTVRPSAAQCPDGSPPPCRSAASSTPAPNSVAVLYFDNLSRDTSYAYLADGLTEELIVRLGEVRRLDVASRFAVRRFRDRSVTDPAGVGRALRVSYLVSGSLRPGHTRLRVTVELVRAATATRVWGQVYDRPNDDLLALTEDVAGAVAQGVAGKLLPEERQILARGPTANPRAFEHVLKGNYYLARRTSTDAIRAVREYQEALRQDSTLATAYARTALAYELIADWGWQFPGVPPESLDDRIRTAVEHAFRHDTANSDAWLAAGVRAGYSGRYGRTALERAIALDPQNVEAHHLLGIRLAVQGEQESGAIELRRALEIEPERPITIAWLGLVAVSEGRFPEARRWLDSALAVDSQFAGAYTDRAIINLVLGDTMLARADAQTALRLGGEGWTEAQAAQAVIESATGNRAAAWQRMRRVLGPDLAGSSAEEAKVWFAATMALAGETLAALDLLERRPHSYSLAVLAPLPVFEALRNEPRFQRLLDEWRVAR